MILQKEPVVNSDDSLISHLKTTAQFGTVIWQGKSPPLLKTSATEWPRGLSALPAELTFPPSTSVQTLSYTFVRPCQILHHCLWQ